MHALIDDDHKSPSFMTKATAYIPTDHALGMGRIRITPLHNVVYYTTLQIFPLSFLSRQGQKTSGSEGKSQSGHFAILALWRVSKHYIMEGVKTLHHEGVE